MRPSVELAWSWQGCVLQRKKIHIWDPLWSWLDSGRDVFFKKRKSTYETQCGVGLILAGMCSSKKRKSTYETQCGVGLILAGMCSSKKENPHMRPSVELAWFWQGCVLQKKKIHIWDPVWSWLDPGRDVFFKKKKIHIWDPVWSWLDSGRDVFFKKKKSTYETQCGVGLILAGMCSSKKRKSTYETQCGVGLILAGMCSSKKENPHRRPSVELAWFWQGCVLLLLLQKKIYIWDPVWSWLDPGRDVFFKTWDLTRLRPQHKNMLKLLATERVRVCKNNALVDTDCEDFALAWV